MKKSKTTINEVDGWAIFFNFLITRNNINIGKHFTNVETIWHPEWEHFKILRDGTIYNLVENDTVVYHSTSIETVRMELIERFHFYELGKKT